jgi:hypothetical protein
MNNFGIIFTGRSIFVSLTNNVLSDSIIDIHSNGKGSVTQCTIIERRMWYLTTTDVTVSLADPHRRHSYWDFINIDFKVECDEESNDSDFYDLLFEFDFKLDCTLDVHAKLLDAEDQFLLEEILVFSGRYYGETINISFKHPRSEDIVYLTVQSDINK